MNMLDCRSEYKKKIKWLAQLPTTRLVNLKFSIALQSHTKYSNYSYNCNVLQNHIILLRYLKIIKSMK